jgi:hypothetical protein
MLDAVSARAPALLPFATWAYQVHSRLHIRGKPDVELSGDPIPLLFALALQDSLEDMQAGNLLARLVASADGTFLQGLPADVMPFRGLVDLAQ